MATSWTNQTKNTIADASTFVFLIDGTYEFLIDGTYSLLIQSAGTGWSNQTKN